MQVRAVVWDVDDTIFDYRGADTAGFWAHLGAEGLGGRFEGAAEALALWRTVGERHWARFVSGELEYHAHWYERVRDFLAACGPGPGPQPGHGTAAPLDDIAADSWFRRYLTHYEAAWTLFPDTLPALDALRVSHRHAVLSNSAAEHQERKLRTLGVRDRFEALLCAADIGVAKPAAEAFHAACAALGLAPGEVAYVGDRPDTDARGARDAGLLGIWLDRTGTGAGTPGGVHRITGLGQLPALLDGETRFGAASCFG